MSRLGRSYSFEALHAKVLVTVGVPAKSKRHKLQRLEAERDFGALPPTLIESGRI